MTMKMRNSISILLLIVVFNASGQKRPRYDETLPVILSLPPSGAIAQLKTYLEEQPANPSIFLQMAVIYEKRYRDGDPMTDFEYKLGNAKLALEGYSKALQLMDDKGVKRAEEEYFNFGQYDEKGRLSVNYDSLVARVNGSKADLQKFVDFAPSIYEAFTSSFSHYDQAHKIFTVIVGKYPTFKEFYLLYTPAIDGQMDQIKSHYLKFAEAFDAYKAASSAYPTGYNQSLTVREIHTFRLDGLESQINFLKPNIQVWNYAKWVDDTRAEITKEIGSLRASLVTENHQLDARLGTVKNEFGSESFEPLKASKEVLFNLRKYDLNSVVEPLFLYKEKKHDLLYQQVLSSSLDTSRLVDTDRKLYLLGQMIYKIRLADSVLVDVRRRNTPECLSRHSEFLTTHFKGIPGVNTFVDTESKVNRTDFTHYVDQIKTTLYQKLKADSIQEFVAYKKLKIPLFEGQQTEYDSLGDALITTKILKNFDGSMFVTGIMKNQKEKLVQSFICGVTTDKKIAWYNEYLLLTDSTTGRKGHTRIPTLQAVPGGLVVLLNGEDTSKTRVNHLLILDEKGTATLTRKLLIDKYPRTLAFSQRDNSLLVTLKGDRFPVDIFHESELVVASLDLAGALRWQSINSYKGDIAGLLEVEQGFLVVGNFNLIKDKEGRMQRGGRSSEETNTFVQRLDMEGRVVDLKLIKHGGPMVVNRLYRAGDDCINLFGARSAYFSSSNLITDPEVAFHIILNKDLEVLSNSLQ